MTRQREDAMARLRQARTAAEGAGAVLRRAVREAHGDGVPVSHIAEACGVTRQTVYRWVRDGEVDARAISALADKAPA